ncbi:MAG: hypothetical protein Q9163_003574 [Psora crenata]
MADKRPPSLTSRQVRDANHTDMAIGSYKMLEEIGRGSFATVYKASVSKHPGFVAIKSVDVNRLNKKLKENLYSEIHILKGLHHPHIVALIDCKETPAHIHLIMEFCELGDLSYFIKKKDSLNLHETMTETIRKYPNPPGGGLNEVIVRHLLKQLANAMDFLRSKNFIHRDVKPQNLLLDPSPHYYATVKPAVHPFMAHERSLVPNVGVETLPTLKIADFGFARSLPSTSLAETLCGSPLYMAPEILRYEKYDARVDLWSIGTVLYEMLVGKPPFKASNHVELLRRIERGEDKIKFPEEIYISNSLKKMVRGLLKRHPGERMSFQDFFNNTVIKDEIPGLTDGDRALQLPRPEPTPQPSHVDAKLLEGTNSDSSRLDDTEGLSQSSGKRSSGGPQTAALRNEFALHRRLSGTPPRVAIEDLQEKRHSTEATREAAKELSSHVRRPSLVTHATAPNRHILHGQATKNAATAAMERKSSRTSLSSQEKAQQREKALQAREAKERAAQEVAFERDYVLVEKRAVEVNALADELAASPRINGAGLQDPSRGAMIRRATQQGPPTSTTGAQVSPSRAMKRAEHSHHRKGSYERRLHDHTSATSAISKAINMASGRLLGMGFSPPLGIARGGPSPPSYSPFPAYPTTQGSLLMIEDGSKRATLPSDEDPKIVQAVEDCATRSDVVFGFAEVKYKQLIPLAPSMEHGLGLHQADIPERSEGEPSANDDEGLTVDATITLSEEALVLYVKALSILAKSMDVAGAWWARKNRGEVADGANSINTQIKVPSSVKIGNRVNNVVQWVRGRFNETLEKAEFVRLKLMEAQRQLPPEHPRHPNNHPHASHSSGGLGTSADQVVVTPGVTAEKLMYDRALEMSRSAAVNELLGEDLRGCELAYVTAVRMLEAVLEDDHDTTLKRAVTSDKVGKRSSADGESVNGVEAEDRKVVLKLVQSIHSRLYALRKKMHIISRRTSTPQQMSLPPPKSPVNPSITSAPAIATTPPR